ncbi:MAG: translation initiation factor IF-3 [Alphaproteobacteria bacterium CG_4_10_14_0_8_um_filter_37_21]|nr:MAG: translation initiation factor IF-3 [Alphaproteobacteria bacterium CG_4_10_14_0_8_um_filter_37_21]
MNDSQNNKFQHGKKANAGPRLNNEITSDSVRLIGSDGEMSGVVSISDALKMAEDAGLDLVEVSPNASPPVCKIIDYGKYKYEQQKKKNIAKKKQKTTELKEVQMRPMIDTHDLEIKCKAIHRFIEAGNKVKILMRFRGRELSHQEIGIGVLRGVQEQFKDTVRVEVEPRLEGRQMLMVFAPAK